MSDIALMLLSAAVGILIFVNLDSHRRVALGLGLLGAAMGSYLTAQRTIHPSDDILNYQELFFAVTQGDWAAVESLGGGFEVGLPLLLRLFHLLFGDLSLKGLLFCLTFSGTAAAVAVYAWLIPQVAGRDYFGLKLAFSIVFISFFTASHTSRQFLAGVALMPILVLRTTPKGTIALTLLSSLMHTTSILFGFLISICRSRKGSMLLLFFGIWMLFQMDSFLSFLYDFMPSLLQGKLTLLTLQDGANQDVSNIPDLVRLGLLGALVAGSNLLWPNSVPIWTRRYTYLGVISFALLLDVPFVGNRLNHMLLNVAFGLVAMISLQRSVLAMRLALLVGFAYQTRLLLSY